jgi:hypothetical protein
LVHARWVCNTAFAPALKSPIACGAPENPGNLGPDLRATCGAFGMSLRDKSLVPEGRRDRSPRFQPWVPSAKTVQVPKGRLKFNPTNIAVKSGAGAPHSTTLPRSPGASESPPGFKCAGPATLLDCAEAGPAERESPRLALKFGPSPVPEGRRDRSPRFQPWVPNAKTIQVPEGRLKFNLTNIPVDSGAGAPHSTMLPRSPGASESPPGFGVRRTCSAFEMWRSMSSGARAAPTRTEVRTFPRPEGTGRQKPKVSTLGSKCENHSSPEGTAEIQSHKYRGQKRGRCPALHDAAALTRRIRIPARFCAPDLRRFWNFAKQISRSASHLDLHGASQPRAERSNDSIPSG